jgi:hypothetical protein
MVSLEFDSRNQTLWLFNGQVAQPSKPRSDTWLLGTYAEEFRGLPAPLNYDSYTTVRPPLPPTPRTRSAQKTSSNTLTRACSPPLQRRIHPHLRFF